MSSDEFALIDRYFKQAVEASNLNSNELGIGDDCALLQVPEGKQLAISLDTLVEGRHFPEGADAEQIGQRALRVSLSDLAAMGAEPLWLTLGLTVPSACEDWFERFSRGLLQAAHEFGVTLVGGDTTKGPLTLSLQVHGCVAPEAALRRDGASPGDSVYVTGTLGDGAAALAVLTEQVEADHASQEYLLQRFYQPRPHIKEGRLLSGLASAAIDISDGLLADLGHICKASAVSAELQLEQLPLSNALLAIASDEQKVQWPLAGGDDYRLCFTMAPQQQHRLQQLMDSKLLKATKIGEIVSGSGVHCFNRGQRLELSAKGYNHFGNR